ncbi:MAG: cyclase family protein [Bacteroidia bacterium]|nr:cyclase family protein [Bacteroidia bacterium]
MYLELSYVLSEEIPVYPGSPLESYVKNTRIVDGDPSNTTIITHYLHNGTHVDAPFHFDKDGMGIDEVPIENYIFKKVLMIDCPKTKGELISIEDLEKYGDKLYKADILLLNTGYSKFRDNHEKYSDDFPALSLEAAKLIRDELLNLKAIAIDTLSIESAVDGPLLDFQVHKTLLNHKYSDKRPLVVYEDVNIELARNKEIKSLFAIPLRIKGLDGSPVTIVAEI